MGLLRTVNHSETLKGLFIEATSVAICNQLGSPRFPQGDLAAIQQSRHAPEVDTLLGRYEIPPDEREAWGVVAHGIAGVTPPGITIHAPEVPFGRALALAGVSSGDVAELVGGAGPSLAAAVSRVCFRLQAAGQNVDCVSLAGFVLSHHSPDHPARRSHAVKVARHHTIASSGSA